MNVFQWLTLISIGVIGYAYVGYPLLLELLTKLFAKPHQRGKIKSPSVSIILPLHNEAQVVERRIDNIKSIDARHIDLELIIVDDGSVDGTSQRVRDVAGNSVTLLRQEKRKGKSSALNLGVQQASGEILLLTDARAEFDDDAVDQLLMNFVDPSVGAVSGAYLVRDDGNVGASENLYWRYESWIKRNESRLHSTCAVSGTILAIRSKLYRGIPAEIINDDAYLNLDVMNQGYRFIYEDRARCSQVASKSMKDDRLRRRRIATGRFQILFRPSLWPRRSKILLFCYWSHKFLRLFLGIFMLVALVGNVLVVAMAAKNGLSETLSVAYFKLFALTLLLQMLFYSLAALGWSNISFGTKVDKLAKAARFLVNGNLGALQGLSGFVFGTQTVLWKKADKANP